MDLNEIAAILRPADADDLPVWPAGGAPLAGGTWLFSEPQPGLTSLIDLAGLGWDGLEADGTGLRIGAMCTLGRLAAFAAAPDWRAVRLFAPCVEALVGSFKVQDVATVGGNLCLALPAGPMAALMVALNGVFTVRRTDARRFPVDALDFVTGHRSTVLKPGELLQSVHLPVSALVRRTAFRRMSLSATGRSAALLIGTAGDDFTLTVTASTIRPFRFGFAEFPDRATLRQQLRDVITDDLLQRDVHGDAPWRRHVTEVLAEQIREELSCR